ncbi:MAG TPA: lysophospholipid acyltransferase family protein, partial [Gemmata sp.]|nr:lysophospholipid acyltransferase family protein [Gemmata sp.]
MAKPRNRTADFAAFIVVRTIVCVVQMVPPRVAFWLAGAIAWLIYALVPSRRRVALENLVASFPDLADDPARADRLVRDMFRHFVRAVVEGLLLPRKLHISNWRAFMDLYPAVGLPAAMFSPRSALLVTGHFGNWEMAGYTLGALGFRTYAIARVLDNPYLERFVRRLRQATGQAIIAKKDDFDRLTSVLAMGAKVSTLADQDAGPRGVFVNFFGRPASTHKAIALMAIEFETLIVVAGMPRVKRQGRATLSPPAGMEETFYAVEIEEVIDPRDFARRPDAVQAITERYTSALERIIRRYPEQYFWLHRRWKSQPNA